MIRKFALAVLAVCFVLGGPATAATTADLQKAAAELQRRIANAQNLTDAGRAELQSLQASWAAGNTDPAAAWEQLQADLFAVPELTSAQKEKLKAVFAELSAGQIDYTQARDKANAIATSAGYSADDVQILIDFIVLVIADTNSG
ncbi:MAG: hypothetical protein GC201_17410 [Alphaproteobacteria bacterium]|nr:hypothetical protein [Alphaproteobacteria bacterium]